MHRVTFISTVHQENGKCNADELCKILEEENPEVLFLEALENTYSDYDRLKYSSFGIYHEKLEIEAIQKYSNHTSCEYVPVLDNGLSDSFDKKYDLLCKNSQFKEKIDELNSLTKTKGFQFLNSQRCIALHQKMRLLESDFLNENELNRAFNIDIDTYENSMMQNIYSYCEANSFNKAVFMCGSAHRESIIEKIRSFNVKEKTDIDWMIYGG